MSTNIISKNKLEELSRFVEADSKLESTLSGTVIFNQGIKNIIENASEEVDTDTILLKYLFKNRTRFMAKAVEFSVIFELIDIDEDSEITLNSLLHEHLILVLQYSKVLNSNEPLWDELVESFEDLKKRVDALVSSVGENSNREQVEYLNELGVSCCVYLGQVYVNQGNPSDAIRIYQQIPGYNSSIGNVVTNLKNQACHAYRYAIAEFKLYEANPETSLEQSEEAFKSAIGFMDCCFQEMKSDENYAISDEDLLPLSKIMDEANSIDWSNSSGKFERWAEMLKLFEKIESSKGFPSQAEDS